MSCTHWSIISEIISSPMEIWQTLQSHLLPEGDRKLLSRSDKHPGEDSTGHRCFPRVEGHFQLMLDQLNGPDTSSNPTDWVSPQPVQVETHLTKKTAATQDAYAQGTERVTDVISAVLFSTCLYVVLSGDHSTQLYSSTSVACSAKTLAVMNITRKSFNYVPL